MLPHYSALKVAESFKLLEALHPGRIDLGPGPRPRGPTASRPTPSTPPTSSKSRIFIEQLLDLQAYLRDEKSARHHPRAGGRPSRRLIPSRRCGCSAPAARAGSFAAQLGMGFFVCAVHQSRRRGRPPCGPYRQQFPPLGRASRPRRQRGPVRALRRHRNQGPGVAKGAAHPASTLRAGPLLARTPPPPKTAAYIFSPLERERLRYHQSRLVAGTPDQVREQLVELAAAYEV